MGPTCVRAANALVILCICTGSSELSIFAYYMACTCISNSFVEFVPEVEDFI